MAERTFQVVGFSVGLRRFAVDLMRVREILRLPPQIAVRQGPNGVSAVINHRDQVVALVEVARALGEGGPPPSHLLITNVHQVTVGLVIGAPAGLFRVQESQCRPPLSPTPFVLGEVTHAAERYELLDLTALVPKLEPLS